MYIYRFYSPEVPALLYTDTLLFLWAVCLTVGNILTFAEEDTTDDPNSPEKLYGSSLPVWCSESASLPAVYKKILYLSLAFDGSIDTNKLYKLLLSSNVSKERLRDIWEIANKRTPGVLVEQELYLVLGLVALTQVCFILYYCKKMVLSKKLSLRFQIYSFMYW